MRKRTINKAKSQRKEANIKIRADINETERKKIIERINETKG